jgi:hypothetical protein
MKEKRERNETERSSGSELVEEEEDKIEVRLTKYGLSQIHIFHLMASNFWLQLQTMAKRVFC